MDFERFEQSMERLKERHEALTQTVELMLDHRRDWERDWELKMERWQEKMERWQDKTQVLMAQVIENIDSLARIAQVHERRISNLEGGRQ